MRALLLFCTCLCYFLFDGKYSTGHAQEGGEVPQYVTSRPGLMAINESKFISEEITGQETLIDFSTFPLSDLKDNPDQPAELNEVICYRQDTINCLLLVKFDEQQKIIFAKQDKSNNWSTSFIPTERLDGFALDLRFVSVSKTAITLSFGNQENRQILIWDKQKNKLLQKYLIKDSEFVFLKRVYKSTNITSMGLITPLLPLVTATDTVQWLLFHPDGSQSKIDAKRDCRPTAIINDKIICLYWGDKVFDHHKNKTKVWREKYRGYNLIYIAPTKDNDIYTDPFGNILNFHYLKDSKLAFTVFEDGWQRPYIFDASTLTASPLLEKDCNPGQQHISALAATSKGDAVILNYYSPLQSSHYRIATLNSKFDQNCLSDGRMVTENKDNFDLDNIKIKRLKTDKRDVPILLLHSKAEGKAKGQLMLQSYGAYGVWNDEGYSPAWASQWLAEGGSIAFVHIRGGSGYGPSWWKAGRGIKGKLEAEKDLMDATQYLHNIDGRFTNKTSIYAGSAGGILASSGALKNPKLIKNVILRAPCMSFTAGIRYECSESNDFGNTLIEEEALLMATISPRDIAATATEFPNFIFLIPEFDDRVDQQNIYYGASTIPDKYKSFYQLPGAYHTDPLPEKEEEALINSIVSYILDNNSNITNNDIDKK